MTKAAPPATIERMTNEIDHFLATRGGMHIVAKEELINQFEDFLMENYTPPEYPALEFIDVELAGDKTLSIVLKVYDPHLAEALQKSGATLI